MYVNNDYNHCLFILKAMSQFSQMTSRVLSLISVVLYNQMVLEWTSRCSALYIMIIIRMHIITCMLNIPMHTSSLEFNDHHVFGN